MIIARPFIRLMCCLLVAAPLLAEQNASPGINRHYQDADVMQWRGVFERDGREVWDRREDIIRHLRLQPGQTVADVGAGTGFLTLAMARVVGADGRVFAVDITPNFVAAIEQRAQQQGLGNVIGVTNDPYSVHLPADSIDLVFTSDTYHHFEYPKATLRSIHDALKPGGELVVVDFRRLPGVSNPWVLSHVRAGEAEVVSEIEAAGFALVERLEFMQTQYFLRFRKIPPP